jgi:hypothetical protein
MIRTSTFLLAGLLSAFGSFSQDVKPDSTKIKDVDVFFSVGGGSTRFFGDIEDSTGTNVHFLGNRAAVDFTVGVQLSRSFMLSINGIYGKLSGNENEFGYNRNFETEMFQIGLSSEYNFAGLFKNQIPVINPFITAGAYYSNYFNLTTDLVNKDGISYHYWSDNTIMDRAETQANHDDAEQISRDYIYETKLSSKATHGFAASVGVGIDLHLSKAFGIRFMTRYFFSFTDKIDGYNKGSGSKWNDGFFFTGISLVVNTKAFDPNRKEEEPVYRYLFDFSKLDAEDEDNDGVVDLADECAGTEKGAKVDQKGCPIDTDLDGIPDHMDKDKNSPEGSIVDQNGIPVDYELIAQQSDSAGTYRLHWEKKYLEPRNPDEEGYTVQVGFKTTLESDTTIESQVRMLPELREVKMNDSLTVFYLGNYKEYDEADLKKRELIEQGVDEAYTVEANSANKAANQMVEIDSNYEELRANSEVVKSIPEPERKSKPVKLRITSVPVKDEYKAADLDGDGLITANEIEKALENILEGKSEFTTEQFNEMATDYTDFTENADPIDFGGIKVVYVDGKMTILTTEDGEASKDSRILLARKYTETDFNGDGELSPNEVQQMIHMFRMGESPYSDEKIHELIDLYFD